MWRQNFQHQYHSTFKRLPSSSNGRYTASRALRRERVGPQEPPAVKGASRVRVVSYPLWLLSAIAGNHVLWRLSHSGQLHREKNDPAPFFFSGFFSLSLGLHLLFFCEKAKVFSFGSFFSCFFPLGRTDPKAGLCGVSFVIKNGRKSGFSLAANPSASLFDVPSYRDFGFISWGNQENDNTTGILTPRHGRAIHAGLGD